MIVDVKNSEISVYWNGEFEGKTSCSHTWIINGAITDNSVPFTIGMLVSGTEYKEVYSKVDIYACRLYNKVLTADEIKANYDKTVAYHNLLVQSKN